LGGYLTVNYDWRWIFLINLPIGLAGFLAAAVVLRDPEYLKVHRKALLKEGLRLDVIGLGLLVLAISSWEVILSKGQEWDWFGDPFWRVQTLVGCFVIGMGLLIWRQLRISRPLINLKPLADPNFAVCCVICFCAYAVLYGASTTLPGMLQALYGYDALASGLVLSPSGVFAIITILITGAIFARGVDSRWFIAGGLLLMAAGCYWMSTMTLDISPWQVVWPRVVMIMGLSMMFAPLNVAAYHYIPRELRASAVGLFALLRNEGGSVGTSIAQTMEIRREQFHTTRMGEFLDPLNPAVTDFLRQTSIYFQSFTADSAEAQAMALQALSNQRQIQAASLAYFDDFYLFAVLAISLLLLLLFMRKSAPEKGAHTAAE
jgi:DHA2 family multidrug resistance protein